MVFLYIFLGAANLILGIWGKKSKLFTFLSYFIIILLMSLNTKGPDIGNYIYDYNSNKSGQVIIAETGYNYLRYFFSNTLNLDFFWFHLFIAVVCIALLRSTIIYTKANENFVLGWFMAYLFFIDTIQIRNFLIEAIFIYSARFLFTNKRFNVLKYIICILVAFLFHKIALIYLLLLVCKLKHRTLLIKTCFWASIIAFIFFMISRTSLSSLIIFITQLLNLKASYSFTATRFSFVPIVTLYFAELIILIIYKKKIGKKLNNNENKFIKCLIEIQMILTLSLSLLLINMNFYRIIRNILILNYIAYAICLSKIPKRSFLFWGMVLFVLISTIGWFISDYIFINKFEIIAEPIFTGNLVFNSTVNNINYSITLKILFILIVSLLYSIGHKVKYKR